MTLARCSRGHFYDEDKFDKCPHCGVSQPASGETIAVMRNNDVTAMLAQRGRDTQPASHSGDAPSKDAMRGTTPGAPQSTQSAQSASADNAAGSDTSTVGYYSRAIGTNPVVGWLVCVEGNHLGEDFRLTSGRNTIGRATGMDVPITGDNTVSREKHAFVVYDPQTHQFLVLPGDCKELCYLNETLILTPAEIKANDILKVGATKLMFIPCCTDRFNWDNIN